MKEKKTATKKRTYDKAFGTEDSNLKHAGIYRIRSHK